MSTPNLMDLLREEAARTEARLAVIKDLLDRATALEGEVRDTLNSTVPVDLLVPRNEDPIKPGAKPVGIVDPPQARRRRGRRQQPGNMAQVIVGHLRDHPGGTAGEIAGALGLNRDSVSSKLTDMTKQGYLTKLERGYGVKE